MKSGTRTRQLRDPPAGNSDGPVTQSPFETRRFRWRRISAIARISASRERTRSVGEVISACPNNRSSRLSSPVHRRGHGADA